MSEIQYSRPLLVAVLGSSTYGDHTVAGVAIAPTTGFIIMSSMIPGILTHIISTIIVQRLNNPTWTYAIPH